jgi:hypothetical protein
VYIDDFEGSTSAIDLRFPLTSWNLASAPSGLNGQYPPLFPEANYNDSLPYGYNRARLAWYNIDPTLQNTGGGSDPDSYEKVLLGSPDRSGPGAEYLSAAIGVDRPGARGHFRYGVLSFRQGSL